MNIYCSGIGGIGLSAYAALQHARGHRVAGSDRNETDLIRDLRSQGISVTLNQDGSQAPDDADLFVYSEAIPRHAPERQRAYERRIPQKSYFAALGDLTLSTFTIAVCGTHGKSSTTAMAAKILIDAAKDPTVVVGTKVPQMNGRNWRNGSSDLFLVEACEYRGNFLHLHPDLILMTNVDGDHFDAFDSLEDYQQTFISFLKKIPVGGKVVTHLSDADSRRVVKESGKDSVDADHFTRIQLSVPGFHMIQNAQLVLGMAEILGIPLEQARASLKDYKGCWRRMEVRGKCKMKNEKLKMMEDILVIDDYGHHPREVRATLKALKEAYPNRRLVCVFQPHTHDRTIKLYDDFMSAFGDADVTVITDVYDARHDIEREEVDIEKFAKDCGATYGGSLAQTEALLRDEILTAGDVLMCMGAGDVTDLATLLLSCTPQSSDPASLRVPPG